MFRKLKNKFVFMYMGTVTFLLGIFFVVIYISLYRATDKFSNEVLKRIENSKELPPMPKDNMKIKMMSSWDIGVNSLGKIETVLETGQLKEKPFLDIEFYTELISLAEGQNKSSGKFGNQGNFFKFKRLENRYIFLDITVEKEVQNKFLHRALFTMLPLLIFLYMFSNSLSVKWVKPIEESFNRQKQFIADASHELKTPLTAISANLDILTQENEFKNNRWLEYIKEENSRMIKLTETLLYLAKLDFLPEENIKEKIDFSKMIEKQLLGMDALFFEKKLNLKEKLEKNIEIIGDPLQIKQLLEILVENAIKYSTGKVEVSLKKIGENAELKISNSFPHMEKEELEKIWNRFYRGDKSRKYVGGFGLGLPIAKEIANRHKASLKAESIGEEIHFILTLASKIYE